MVTARKREKLVVQLALKLKGGKQTLGDKSAYLWCCQKCLMHKHIYDLQRIMDSFEMFPRVVCHVYVFFHSLFFIYSSSAVAFVIVVVVVVVSYCRLYSFKAYSSARMQITNLKSFIYPLMYVFSCLVCLVVCSFFFFFQFSRVSCC